MSKTLVERYGPIYGVFRFIPEVNVTEDEYIELNHTKKSYMVVDMKTDKIIQRGKIIPKELSLETCRGIAARIWCDADYEHIIMDPIAAEEIAQILHRVANRK